MHGFACVVAKPYKIEALSMSCRKLLELTRTCRPHRNKALPFARTSLLQPIHAVAVYTKIFIFSYMLQISFPSKILLVKALLN